MARHSASSVWPGNRFARNIVEYVINVLLEATITVLGSGIVVGGQLFHNAQISLRRNSWRE